jgi:hypothetical protein
MSINLQFQCFSTRTPTNLALQTLLRFNLQPCSLSKPFTEKVIGFTVHTDMNFIVTERQTVEQQAAAVQASSGANADAGALPGSYDS